MTYRTHTVSHILEVPRELRTMAHPGDRVIVDAANRVSHLLSGQNAYTLFQLTERVTGPTRWYTDRGATCINPGRVRYAYRDGASVFVGALDGTQGEARIAGLGEQDIADLCAIAGVYLDGEKDDVTIVGDDVFIQYIEPEDDITWKAGEV